MNCVVPVGATPRPGQGSGRKQRVAPRLAESIQMDASTEPFTEAHEWLKETMLNSFTRDALRIEVKRRGLSPTGLKAQLGIRLARDSTTQPPSIWRLAALQGRPGFQNMTLGDLESEASLIEFLRRWGK